LAGFEAAGESGADAVLAHFSGASPASAEFSGLKHFNLQAHVDGEAGKAASEGDLAGGGVGGNARAASGVSGGSSSGFGFFFFTHTPSLPIQLYRSNSSLVRSMRRSSAAVRCLVAVEQIAGFERQFSRDLDDRDAAVNGVYV